MQICGSPYHLWGRENLTKIADHIDKAVAIDSRSLELTKIDAAKIKVEMDKVYPSTPRCRITIFPLVLEEDVKLGFDMFK